MADFTDWLLFGIPSFILAGTVHEYMHAWTARRLGDYTATVEGRLTLNPLAHLDLIGTLMMVFARFGWMRPVPINEYNFENRVVGTALTAAAGPASNLVMAIGASLLFRSLSVFLPMGGDLPIMTSYILLFLFIFTWVNIALMLFNLIPIPPLDGYRIVRAFLPNSVRYYWEQLEKFSIFVLILLFIPNSPLSNFTLTYLSAGVSTIFSFLLGVEL